MDGRWTRYFFVLCGLMWVNYEIIIIKVWLPLLTRWTHHPLGCVLVWQLFWECCCSEPSESLHFTVNTRTESSKYTGQLQNHASLYIYNTFSVEWQPYLNCSLMFADGSDHQLPGSIYFYILPVDDYFWTKARCNGAVQVFHLAWPLLCCFSPLAGPSAPGSCRFSAEAPSCPTHHTTSCSWYDSCAGGAESDITFLVKRERAVKLTEKSWKCCCLSTVWKRMVVWHMTDRWTECSHRLRSLFYGLWAFMVDYSLHCLYFPLNGHYVVLEKKLELRILIFTILMRSIRNIL